MWEIDGRPYKYNNPAKPVGTGVLDCPKKSHRENIYKKIKENLYEKKGK